MNRPEPWSEPPPGFHFEAVPDGRWVTPPAKTKAEPRCRFTVARYRTCRAPAVASLNRAQDASPQWWHYCADHLYGRWIEDGRVVSWRLVKDAE